MRSGLERVALLPVGAGYAEVTAGVAHSWQAGLAAFVRGEVGFRPRDNVDLFGFAQVDRAGAQAGVGARVSW